MRRQRNKWKVKENREIKIWWYYLEIRTIVEFSIFEIFVISKCNVIHHLCYKTFCHLNRTNLCYIVQIISGTKKHKCELSIRYDNKWKLYFSFDLFIMIYIWSATICKKGFKTCCKCTFPCFRLGRKPFRGLQLGFKLL